jgi:hypothetical protein
MFHELAAAHHGDGLDDRHIVRYEQIGETGFLLQFEEQAQHLATHRRIKRGDAFVRHDDARFERQRSGDVDALTLSAGEFVRVTACVIGQEVISTPFASSLLSA